MATPTSTRGETPSSPPPEALDYADNGHFLRLAHPTGIEDHFDINDDQSQEEAEIIRQSGHPASIVTFLARIIRADPTGSSSQNHFRAGCENEISLFMRMAFNFLKTILPGLQNRTYLRFATISFLEGPDRALLAFETGDDLWENFMPPDVYQRMPVLFGSRDLATDSHLEHLRHLFYGRISQRQDPRTSEHYGPHREFIESGEDITGKEGKNLRYLLPGTYAMGTYATDPPPQTPRFYSGRSQTDEEAIGVSTRPLNRPATSEANLDQSHQAHQMPPTTESGAVGGAPLPPQVSMPQQPPSGPPIRTGIHSAFYGSLLDADLPSTTSMPALQPSQAAASTTTTATSGRPIPSAFPTGSVQEWAPFSYPSYSGGTSGFIPPASAGFQAPAVSAPASSFNPLPRIQVAVSQPSHPQQPAQPQQPLQQQQPQARQDDVDEEIPRPGLDEQRRASQGRPQVSILASENALVDAIARMMGRFEEQMQVHTRAVQMMIENRPSSRSSSRAPSCTPAPAPATRAFFNPSPTNVLDPSHREYVSPSYREHVFKPVPILPTAGRVIDPLQPIPLRRRVQISGMDPVAQFSHDNRLDPVSAGLALGFSKAHRKASRESRALDFTIEKVNPLAIRTSIDSFDFNIHGRTAEEILGDRFRTTYFETENARLATMRAIFQRVVDDPNCSHETKMKCLETMGKFDPPREQSNNILMSTISTMGALAGTFPGSLESGNADRVEPPLLGHLTISDPAVTKELFFNLGLQMGEKYKPGARRPLKFYLQGVSSRITMMRLCSESAYNLLLSILEGDLYEEVYRMKEEGCTFSHTWEYIQNIAMGQVSRDALTKELEDLYKNKPSSVSTTLSRIQEIRIQHFKYIPGKAERESVTSAITLLDFKSLISQYYGATATAAIETLYNHELARQEKERQLYEMQGLHYKTSFNKVRTYKVIACTYINQLVVPAKGPSMVFSHGMTVEGDGNNMAQLHIASLNANSTTMAAPSTSAPSHRSMGTTSHGSVSNKGPRRAGSISGSQSKQQRQNPSSGFPSQNSGGDHQSLMQAVFQQKHNMNQKASQAQAQYESQTSSPYPPPDFTKLLYPIERLMTKRDRSAVPASCWEKIGMNTCFLCAVPLHFYDECPLYPNQMPVDRQCACSGFHQSECRGHLRYMMDHVVRNGWSAPKPPPKPEGYNGGNVQYAPRPAGNNDGQRNGYNNNGYNNGNGRGYQGNNNNRFNNGGRQGGNGYRGNNDRRFDRRNGSNGQGPRRDGNGQNNFGYPNQTGTHVSSAPLDAGGHTIDGVNPAGQAANRVGGGLGNGGNQVAPGGIFMSPMEATQVQKNNKQNN